jgi:plastocyanin
MLGRLVWVVLAFSGATALAHASAIDVSVTDAKGLPAEDAVVVAVPLAGPPAPSGAPTTAVVDQIDKEFVPLVSVVRTMTSVSFPNKDNIKHHVYSFSAAKRFELPLYKGKPAKPVLFDHAGLVVLGCNIHDWMVGYVYVVDSPWFAKTGNDGNARLSDLPAGDYEIVVYHPRAKDPAEPVRQRIAIESKPSPPLRFQLPLKKPVPRPHVPKSGDVYE